MTFENQTEFTGDMYESNGIAPGETEGNNQLSIFELACGTVADNTLRGDVSTYTDEQLTALEGLAQLEQYLVTVREKLANIEFLPTISDMQPFLINESADKNLKELGLLDNHDNLLVENWLDYINPDDGNEVFEIYTQEYVDKMAGYLFDTYGTSSRPINILEVGAGNGKLTYHLQKKLDEMAPKKFYAVAVDDFSRVDDGTSDGSPISVVKMDYEEALDLYHPTVVISSWMPLDKDWTPSFVSRKIPEFILIGDVGCTGDSETWESKDGYEDDSLDLGPQLSRLSFVGLKSRTRSYRLKK